MKKSLLNAIATFAIPAFAVSSAIAQPTVSAPTPPELRESKVISVYSDAYTSTGFNFGEWGSGTQYSKEKITGTDDNVAKFTTAQLGYFGWVFPSAINAASMTNLHIDFYAENAAQIQVFPICSTMTQGEKFLTLDIKAGEWTSFDVEISKYSDLGLDMAGVTQFKFAGIGANTLYIDNAYFYSTSTDIDTEKPQNLTATVKKVSFNSITLECSATDNSGAITYLIADEANGVSASQGGASGKTTEVVVNGLSSNKEYKLTISAKDTEGNVCDQTVTLNATTLQTPVSATKPTVEAADVISIFSDVYTPATKFSFGGWGQTTVASQIALADDDNALLLEKANYLGLELNGNVANFDASEMTYLHIDVYTNDATRFAITPIWGGEALYECTPVKQGEWNSFDIPLQEAYPGINLKNIYQIKIANIEPASTSTVFVDNIYFYKKVTAPDNEAPVLSKVETDVIGTTTAKITATATDNQSTNLTYEVSAKEDFSEIAATASGKNAEKTAINIAGLEKETAYKFYVRAKDAAGNISNVETVEFTTVAEATEIASFTGTIDAQSSLWSESNYGYNPSLSYKITTMSDYTLKIKIILSGIAEGFNLGSISPNCYINNEGTSLSPITQGVDYEGITAKTYNDGDELQLRFYIPAEAGLWQTSEFAYTVGSGTESGVNKVANENIRIYASNGIINIEGAEGEITNIFSVSGALVYKDTLTGNFRINLPKGLYIVTVGGKTVKVIL